MANDAAMADFENEHLKGKSLEQLVDELGGGFVNPQSVVGEAMKAAIQARMVERLAKPQKWANVSIAMAVLSALAAVGSTIAAFS